METVCRPVHSHWLHHARLGRLNSSSQGPSSSSAGKRLVCSPNFYLQKRQGSEPRPLTLSQSSLGRLQRGWGFRSPLRSSLAVAPEAASEVVSSGREIWAKQNARPTQLFGTHAVRAEHNGVDGVHQKEGVETVADRGQGNEVASTSESYNDAAPGESSESKSLDSEQFRFAREKEMERRRKIGLANKGRLPWNKGKPHSLETRQKIAERTRLAMQDPIVKEKLKKSWHAQTDTTKRKIQESMRQTWLNKREVGKMQKVVLKEWKNAIAVAARSAGSILSGNDPLLEDEKPKRRRTKEAKEEKQKSGRTEKSPEHRARIAQAIKAKWQDEGYRRKVQESMQSLERKPRRVMQRKAKPAAPRRVRKVVERGGVAEVAPNGEGLASKVEALRMQRLMQLNAKKEELEQRHALLAEKARAIIAAAEAAAAQTTASCETLATLEQSKKMLAEAQLKMQQAINRTEEDIASLRLGASSSNQDTHASEEPHRPPLKANGVAVKLANGTLNGQLLRVPTAVYLDKPVLLGSEMVLDDATFEVAPALVVAAPIANNSSKELEQAAEAPLQEEERMGEASRSDDEGAPPRLGRRRIITRRLARERLTDSPQDDPLS